jgi:hypothetical protein
MPAGARDDGGFPERCGSLGTESRKPVVAARVVGSPRHERNTMKSLKAAAVLVGSLAAAAGFCGTASAADQPDSALGSVTELAGPLMPLKHQDGRTLLDTEAEGSPLNAVNGMTQRLNQNGGGLLGGVPAGG